MKLIVLIGTVLAAIVCVNGHTYQSGSCPVVEPMQGFDMNKFLGIWYVMQKTSTASNCMTYNFTRTDEPGQYLLRQDSQHFGLQYLPIDHEYRYTGKLTVKDPSIPARMTVSFPLSVAGSASYTILATDYDTFAGIYTCQSLAFAHRHSATILSRTKTLDKAYIDKIRNRLASFNVNPYDLSIVSQSDCPKRPPGADPNYNINIDDSTFTAHSAAGVIRKAGEKIGDGVEYIAGAAKSIYSKGKHYAESSHERESLENPSPKRDTEWLP